LTASGAASATATGCGAVFGVVSAGGNTLAGAGKGLVAAGAALAGEGLAGALLAVDFLTTGFGRGFFVATFALAGFAEVFLTDF
jgi:hypothetical protein